MRKKSFMAQTPGIGDQPEIKEPKIEIGAEVWHDECGVMKGSIVKITTETIIVNYGKRISSYPANAISVALIPPFLVLVADGDETVIHKYS
jgi:hypothetical protein